MGQGRDRPGQPWGMGVERDRNQSYGHEKITVLNHRESGKIVFNTRVEPLCFEVFKIIETGVNFKPEFLCQFVSNM